MHSVIKLSGQFIRYCIVGTVAFGVDFSILYLLTEVAGLHYLASAALAFIIALSLSYLLAVTWVFDYRSLQNRLHEFLAFVAIGGVGLLLTEVMMFSLTEAAGWHYLQSKVAATIAVLFFNFIAKKVLLFSPVFSLSGRVSLGHNTGTVSCCSVRHGQSLPNE